MSEYDWHSTHGPPTNNPTLEWTHTFHQRKAHLAKIWDDSREGRRKSILEKVVYYSAIREVKKL